MKTIAKALLRGVAMLLMLPLLALDILLRPLGSDEIFSGMSQFLSLLPGRTGSYLRLAFYRFAMRRCQPTGFIGFGTVFSQRDTEIGDGVYIGPHCNIGASRICDDVLLASGVHIMSGTQQHRFINLDEPIREQGGEFIPVTVGEDSWIGNGALVMADIGKKCVIGAGSVVTRPIPDRAVAAGNPARVLRMRGEEATGRTTSETEAAKDPSTQRSTPVRQ